jgi:hypothetical protein
MRDIGAGVLPNHAMRPSGRAMLSRGVLCALSLLLAGDRSTPASDTRQKILGSWGGFHAGLTLTETGGTLEFDCARGSIDEPFLVDTQGKFDFKGTYVREHPGPIHSGEKPERYPARYTGSVQGDRMTITGMVPDRNQSLGPFELFQGKKPNVHKCL